MSLIKSIIYYYSYEFLPLIKVQSQLTTQFNYWFRITYADTKYCKQYTFSKILAVNYLGTG